MNKSLEKFLLFLSDLMAVHTSFYLWCRLRVSMGMFAERSFWGVAHISLLIFLFWFLLFSFFGLYRIVYTQSRTDEFISVFKAVSAGVIVIFLMTFDMRQDLSQPMTMSRVVIISYWGLMVFFVSFGRILLRTIHRKLLEMGIGRRRALIVGWGKKARDLFDQLQKAPALGYDVVGFVSPVEGVLEKSHEGVFIKGDVGDLHDLIRGEEIQEVIVALSQRSERQMEKIIGECDGTQVGIKIVPGLYDVIVGQVKTNQIYGFPLIEVIPQLMPTWERIIKRLFDFAFSLVIIVGFLPFWILVALAIVIDSPGPVFYSQERMGKNGKVFKVHKFRSMVANAEKKTGPVWAAKKDDRITRVGRIIRKMRIDEFPQFINILDGHMSLVGPRPERPFFVEKLRQEIPLYTRRLRIRPGITGWAQVKGEYDTTLDNVRQKLEFDLFYIENMSLRMDLKIVLHTIYVMLAGKGQ